MRCSSCINSGSNLGCPCQEPPRENCPVTFAGNRTVFRDPCTGEQKRALPHVENQRSDYGAEVVIAKVLPKKGPCVVSRQPCQEKKCCKETRQTVCYTCGDKRPNCYPEDKQCYGAPHYVDAFENVRIGKKDSDDWAHFSNQSDFIANDGVVKSTKEGLVITARKFCKTYETDDPICQSSGSGFLDHFKNFIIRNSDFAVPDCGELYAEACMSARTWDTQKHPFGDAVLNPYSDLRLAYGAFSMIDLTSGLHIAFALTNDSIYALYERLPLETEETNEDEIGPNSFAFAHLVGRRNYKNPMKDFARLGLALDKRKGAKWYVNGVLKHQVDRLGHLHDPAEMLYDLGGEPKDIELKCVNIGFGLFTMLDAVHPMNHRDIEAAGTGLVRLTDFKYYHPWIHNRNVAFVTDDNVKESKLFGQGATIQVKEIKVENRC